MAKRRTSGIQRRQRASTEAMSRRLDAPGGFPVDWRLLAIGGVLVVGLVILVAFVLLSGPPPESIGQRFSSSGQGHLDTCVEVRLTDQDAYSSIPATSGPHCGQTAQWGVHATPQMESLVVHNLEHGGIVIWYQPDQVDQAQIDELANYVDRQVQQGQSARYKFLLSPWAGEDFGHPIAVTSWTWLLYQDEVDLDAIRQFADEHYGDAPEPNAP
jgi:hypothetical protein